MRLEIDIPEHHYNNIMALDSVSLGRVPYKGILMYSINAIKHGKVLEKEPKSEWKHDHEILKAYSNGTNEVLDKIIAEIKEWYWQANKQELAKDPCVVDAMIDLFIRTIDKYKAESEES